MKTGIAAGVVVVLSLIALPGCTDKSTVGGQGASDEKPLIGEADNSFKLTVPGSVPYATAVKEGESTPFTVGIKRGKNFNQDVSLKFEGPAGVTVEPAGAAIKAGASDAKLTLKAADDAAPGSYDIKVIGTPSKGPAAVSEFKITVNKKATFSISVPTLSTSIKQGETKVVSIGVKRESGFDEDVTLKFDDLPKGVTIEPTSPVVKQGDKDAQIKIKAADDAGLGDKTFKVTGHPAKGSDAVQEFKLTDRKSVV